MTVDYNDETILLGHDGPFHIAIAEGKPILRGDRAFGRSLPAFARLYHGKQGSGVSVEAKVRSGPVTTLNVTQTPVKFRTHPDDYMAQWFAEAPTHHCAMSIGHNAALFQKVGELLEIKHVIL